MNRNIEILAPAGSYDGMRAAMNAGCDAVYIGGKSFGARAFAENPEEDRLLWAIDEAHIRGKKLYLTVNTLLKEKELTGELYRFLDKFYLQGLDAVIVQDVGVLHFIHQNFPGLPIHASTQMTLTMAQGANLLKEYGVTRLVTSRELSLQEIKTIRNNTELEIETFVHGALCYCYSGQCLMSSMIGGRSGNRGRCAQPCRMPYQFYAGNQRMSSEQEKYLLSPKDINTLVILPELIEAGIDSFKIEGRMKRPEYAAAVSSVYRRYVDLYDKLGAEGYRSFLDSSGFREDMLMLQDVYNRGGFSEGYGRTYHGKKMMSMHRPNHSGVLVGEVKDVKGDQAAIIIKEKVNAQDILEIRHLEEEVYEFTVKEQQNPGDTLRTRFGSKSTVHTGDLVFRTKNNSLLDHLTEKYLKKDKQTGIKGILKARVGEPLSFTVFCGDMKAAAYHNPVETAQKQPMSAEKIKTQLEKTGDTFFFFEELIIDAGENIFIPVVWLNEIRREAIRLLQETIIEKYRRDPYQPAQSDGLKDKRGAFPGAEERLYKDTREKTGMIASVQTKEQWETALSFPEITAVYACYETFSVNELLRMADRSAAEGKDFYMTLPHICRLSTFERLNKDLFGIIENDRVKGFIVKNFEEAALLQSLLISNRQGKELILNYNMYTYNQEAKSFWKEQGISRFTTPAELNYKELKELGVSDYDMVVYGYLPLMVSAQCLFENTKGCRKNRPAGPQEDAAFDGILSDRLGKQFYVETRCNECYNIIYNGQPLALHKLSEEILNLRPANIRLDFTKETKEQTRKVIKLFIDRYRNGLNNEDDITDYTTGHFKRGIV